MKWNEWGVELITPRTPREQKIGGGGGEKKKETKTAWKKVGIQKEWGKDISEHRPVKESNSIWLCCVKNRYSFKKRDPKAGPFHCPTTSPPTENENV